MRLGNVRDAAGLLTGLNVLGLEVAAIGDDVDRLDVQNLAGRFCGLRQKPNVYDLVGHRLLGVIVGSSRKSTISGKLRDTRMLPRPFGQRFSLRLKNPEIFVAQLGCLMGLAGNRIRQQPLACFSGKIPR